MPSKKGVSVLKFLQGYYPFGGTFQQYTSTSPSNLYTYNGKERQLETGWIDYGFRMYDPYSSRWFNLDPLANEYYSLSPYNYVANNPIKNIDPDGRFIGTVVGAIVGAAAGAIDASINNKDILSSVFEGATAGAITGAVVDLTVATGGTGLVLVGAAALGGAVGGATGDIVGQTINNTVNNEQTLSEAVNNIDGSQVFNKAVTGAVAGAVGGSLGVGAGKLTQAAAASTKTALGKAGASIAPTAAEITKQGVTKTIVNGVPKFTQTPGLTNTVQGVMNNMTSAMGQSGRAAANMMVVTEAVTTGVTETATKLPVVTKTATVIDQIVNDLFEVKSGN